MKTALAEAVRQRVDERGKIGPAAGEAGETFPLARALILDQRRDERHRLDTETGFDGLDLRGEELGEVRRIARRGRGADPDGLGLAIDAVEIAIEPPRALAGAAELDRDIRARDRR